MNHSPQNMELSEDRLITLMFASKTTRANMTQITTSGKRILANHVNLRREATDVLGQLTVASILLSSTIKHKGSVALQVYGEGAIKLAYAECNFDFAFKSTLKLRSCIKNIENLSFKKMVNGSKKGVFSVIIDQKIKNQKPYQGIISIEGNSVSEMIRNYLKNSEQIDSDLILSANSKIATGILIQKMPTPANENNSEWSKIQKIINQLQSIDISQDSIYVTANHYFKKQKHKILKIKTPTFSCHCSVERAIKLLRLLGRNETQDLIYSKGKIQITCEFCNTLFSFDERKYASLFDQGF